MPPEAGWQQALWLLTSATDLPCSAPQARCPGWPRRLLAAESSPQLLCVKALIHRCRSEELPHPQSASPPTLPNFFFFLQRPFYMGDGLDTFTCPRSSNFSVTQACASPNARGALSAPLSLLYVGTEAFVAGLSASLLPGVILC